jgi:hypothetical protein
VTSGAPFDEMNAAAVRAMPASVARADTSAIVRSVIDLLGDDVRLFEFSAKRAKVRFGTRQRGNVTLLS